MKLDRLSILQWTEREGKSNISKQNQMQDQFEKKKKLDKDRRKKRRRIQSHQTQCNGICTKSLTVWENDRKHP